MRSSLGNHLTSENLKILDNSDIKHDNEKDFNQLLTELNLPEDLMHQIDQMITGVPQDLQVIVRDDPFEHKEAFALILFLMFSSNLSHSVISAILNSCYTTSNPSRCGRLIKRFASASSNCSVSPFQASGRPKAIEMFAI